ncbi:MAG: hypothetical protein AVDCRST_MAG56-3987 [uncultured Cytophagales bacterium]|uniref:HTH cro/C1-type domain-containing protein n=1 Tax=uncultured Cytophagales bacterium TaxID=158755 RepID=A0A6J4JPV2_9SPHI|nr:MAG: hypothetical protein AVDCRST_MAG56-3987 [uncultured Cytophagales bacterium]
MATKLGEYLERKMINKAELGRKAGLTRQRVSELSTRTDVRMRLEEGYAIAKALGISVDELCRELGMGETAGGK